MSLNVCLVFISYQLAFHSRKHVEKHLKTLQLLNETDNENYITIKTDIEHCEEFLSFADKQFDSAIQVLRSLQGEGKITFALLWMLFPPGEMVVTSTYDEWDEL